MDIQHLKNKDALDWKNQTGIEIVYNVGSRFKLDEIYKNWKKMPSNLKDHSNKKCIELFGCNNDVLYKKLSMELKYDGYPFILHQHNPRNGSEHYDLRFLDLKNPKLLHSFALPDNWRDNVNKTVLFKTRDHDPRWLKLESYRLKTIDEGTINYKLYRQDRYFLLEFNGKIINGTYQLFKLNNKIRKDVWMFVKKR